MLACEGGTEPQAPAQLAPYRVARPGGEECPMPPQSAREPRRSAPAVWRPTRRGSALWPHHKDRGWRVRARAFLPALALPRASVEGGPPPAPGQRVDRLAPAATAAHAHVSVP